MLKRSILTPVTLMIVSLAIPLAILFLEDSNNTSPYVENSNATFSGNIKQEGDSRIHSLRIYDNVTRIHFILQCGGVDFDLYGRFGELPTSSEYDFRGYNSGGEDLFFDYPEPGIMHLMVYSYSGIGHYDLFIELEYSDV